MSRMLAVCLLVVLCGCTQASNFIFIENDHTALSRYDDNAVREVLVEFLDLELHAASLGLFPKYFFTSESLLDYELLNHFAKSTTFSQYNPVAADGWMPSPTLAAGFADIGYATTSAHDWKTIPLVTLQDHQIYRSAHALLVEHVLGRIEFAEGVLSVGSTVVSRTGDGVVKCDQKIKPQYLQMSDILDNPSNFQEAFAGKLIVILHGDMAAEFSYPGSGKISGHDLFARQMLCLEQLVANQS